MAVDHFFDETTEQSAVKAAIVEAYFDTWAGIMIGAQNRQRRVGNPKIGYIDLFAGPGRYKDGAVSTPVRVLERALSKADYRERLVTIFNDKDEEKVRSLESAIADLPDIEKLKHRPIIWNQEVGDQIALRFKQINTIPLLAFIDPWGYKGLSLRLVNAFLKSWGCDCIFFFNYARINAGLSNPKVQDHMAALFGEVRAERLAVELEGMTPAQREATIVNELALALRETAGRGQRFVLPFCFKNCSGSRTTHHLVLVTKSFKGYDVMKGIMSTRSSKECEGVPSFSYCPATGPEQMMLFELNRPLEELRGSLLETYRGRSMTMRQIYEDHSVDTPYISKNYKDVLREMEQDRAITTAGRKSNRGFADYILVTFPA